VQYAGDNYFVPVDADIAHDVDVPLQAIRISDFMQPLASLPGRVKIVILDAARQNGFAQGGRPLAGGLALVDPQPSLAIAYNAAPGTVAPDGQGPYGAYATALTEMIGTGGLSLDDIFARVRLRVSEETQGAEVPWYAAQIDGPFFITERAADAPPPPNVEPVAQYRSRPMRDFGNSDDAYAAAIALDTIDGYQQFLAIYPTSPYSPRIAAMIAVRREEIAWRHCVINDTPPAYWSYLRRYPDGPHAWDARRRLEFLRAQMEPPPDFVMFDFGVPPPPPDEFVYINRPFIMFGALGFAPPPRPPVLFLPPRPREFAVLPPPPPPRERFALPIPAAAPVAIFVRPPPTVVVRQPPPGAPAGAGAGPGGRPEFRVSLPAAAARAATAAPAAPGTPGGAPGTPGAHPGLGTPATLTPGAAGTSSPTLPPHPGAGPPPHPGAGAPPPPASALARPEPPPPRPAGAAPTIESPPAPGTPAHPGSNKPTQAFEKPAPPPPHPTGPTPTFAKPTPPLPPPHPSVSAPAIEKPVTPPHPAPAMVTPSAPTPHTPPPPPPPHAAPAAAAAKPPPPPPPPPPHPAPHPEGCPPGKAATPNGCK
jgi:hypothetical protein